MVDINSNTPVMPDEVIPTANVVTTPNGAVPYKVVFQLGDKIISEHAVSSMREGEALIKEQLPNIRVSARDPNRNA